MKLVQDKDNPDLVGIIESSDDILVVKRMVENLNKDLIDSGFDKYQYRSVRRGNKIYVERT